MRRRPVPFIALALVLAALAPPLASAQTDGSRLGRDVLPTFESVRLAVDPSRPEFTGTAHVELKVVRAASTFAFHADGPVISVLKLRGPAGDVSGTAVRRGTRRGARPDRSPARAGGLHAGPGVQGAVRYALRRPLSHTGRRRLVRVHPVRGHGCAPGLPLLGRALVQDPLPAHRYRARGEPRRLQHARGERGAGRRVQDRRLQAHASAALRICSPWPSVRSTRCRSRECPCPAASSP